MSHADSAQPLRDFKPQAKFFVGIDSDGCVFDTMEIKHKECFAPMFIKHFHLQAASKYAREDWEFVNLYSKEPRLQPLSRAGVEPGFVARAARKSLARQHGHF